MLRWKVVAAPLSLLIWASYVLIVIAWTPLVFFYRLATRRSDPDRYRLGRFFRNSAVLAGALNPFWKFRVVDRVHPDPRRPYVFVANHCSSTDAFLIVRLPWEMKLISKKSIMRIPLLGWQMRMAGDVPVVRGNKESGRLAMEGLRRWLDRRISVFFFPEGTRGDGGALGRFRKGPSGSRSRRAWTSCRSPSRARKRDCRNTRSCSPRRRPRSPCSRPSPRPDGRSPTRLVWRRPSATLSPALSKKRERARIDLAWRLRGSPGPSAPAEGRSDGSPYVRRRSCQHPARRGCPHGQ